MPYGAPSNQYALNTANLVGNTDVYACAPCNLQPPAVFNNYRQPQPFQHTPCPQLEQLRDQQTPSKPTSFDFCGFFLVDGTSAQPLPITDDQQQLCSLWSKSRISVHGAILPTEGGAQQLLVPVRFNNALIEGTLINFGSSLSMVSTSTLATLPVPFSVVPFTSRFLYIVDIGGAPPYVLCYVFAAFAVSDVEVWHTLVVVDKLS